MQKDGDPRDHPEEILRKLGLTPEEAMKYDPTRLQIQREEKLLLRIFETGKTFFLERKGSGGQGNDGPPLRLRIFNQGSLRTDGQDVTLLEGLSPEVQLYGEWVDFPDTAFRQMRFISPWQSSEESVHEKQQRVKKVLRAFLRGYGIAALENGDFESAVNCFDLITEGMIFDDQELADALAKISQADKSDGVKIAGLLAKRAEKRAKGDPWR